MEQGPFELNRERICNSGCHPGRSGAEIRGPVYRGLTRFRKRFWTPARGPGWRFWVRFQLRFNSNGFRSRARERSSELERELKEMHDWSKEKERYTLNNWDAMHTHTPRRCPRRADKRRRLFFAPIAMRIESARSFSFRAPTSLDRCCCVPAARIACSIGTEFERKRRVLARIRFSASRGHEVSFTKTSTQHLCCVRMLYDLALESRDAGFDPSATFVHGNSRNSSTGARAKEGQLSEKVLFPRFLRDPYLSQLKPLRHVPRPVERLPSLRIRRQISSFLPFG